MISDSSVFLEYECIHILLAYTVMSLLEMPCAKTSWRPLLFHAIFGNTNALVVCFGIWRFKPAKSSETGLGGHHCDFEQHMPCLTVHVCMNSVKFVLVGVLLFRDNVQTYLGGASIREAASNRDIMICIIFQVLSACCLCFYSCHKIAVICFIVPDIK